jgi:hypothetical protein
VGHLARAGRSVLFNKHYRGGVGVGRAWRGGAAGPKKEGDFVGAGISENVALFQAVLQKEHLA